MTTAASLNLSASQAALPRAPSCESHHRFVEKVLNNQLVLPSAAQLAARLRAQQPHLFRHARDQRSAGSLLEVGARVLATAYAMSLALEHALYWMVAPLWLFQALNYFALIALVHDLVHGSAFRSPLVNRLLALLLCPLVLLRYSSFRRAHLLHHKHNQSGQDPKVGKILTDRTKLLPRGFRFLHDRIYQRSSLPVQRLTVFLILLLGSFPIMHASHEFSPFKKPRSVDEWLEAAGLVGFWIAAGLLLGPSAAALILLVPLLFAYPLVGIVFLTHEHEETISPAVTHRDEYELMIFNIRDITLGPILDRLSFYFARYHVAHHLFPSLPFHRLKEASHFIERECAGYLHPVARFDLDHMRRGMVDYCYGRVRKEIAGRAYDVMPIYLQP